MTFRFTSSRCEAPGEASYNNAIDRILAEVGPDPMPAADPWPSTTGSGSGTTNTEPMPTAPPAWVCTLIAGGVLLGMPLILAAMNVATVAFGLAAIGALGIGALRLLVSPSKQKVK